MSEQNKKNSESAQKETECPSCGAKVSARRIYCPECGGIVRPDRIRKTVAIADDGKGVTPAVDENDEKPTADDNKDGQAVIDGGNASTASPRAEIADNTQNSDGERHSDGHSETVVKEDAALGGDSEKPCRKCGKPVETGSKFCKHCGAACFDDGAYCMYCGAHIRSDVNFCKNCGAPTRAAAFSNAAGASAVDDAERLDKARKKSATMLSVTALLLPALLFFFCSICEFLKVEFATTDGPLDISQDFITMIGVAFGGRSALTIFGVPIELLKFTGWLYLCYVIVLAVGIVCTIINLARKKSAPPVGIRVVPATLFLLSTAIFILNLVARSKVDHGILPETEVSVFMNGVGLFVCGFIELFVGICVCFVSWIAYRGDVKKRSRGDIAFRIISGVTAALMCAFVFAPVFSAEAADNVAPDGGGRLTVSLTECVGDGCYGGAVIGLDGLERGERYSFSIKTSGTFGSDFTAESIVLYYADQVEGGGIVNAAFFGDVLEINQTYGPNSAKMLFTAEYSGELAVVLMFAYYVPLTFGVEYELSVAQ